MTTEERLQKINAFAQARDDAKARAENDFMQKCKEMKREIKKLAPRIKELVSVAQALWEKKIPLGRRTTDWAGYKDEFLSEGIHHKLGFIDAEINGIPVYVGEVGGGACGGDFIVSVAGENILTSKYDREHIPDAVFSKDWAGKAEGFLAGFDEFEKRFYEYVDTL